MIAMNPTPANVSQMNCMWLRLRRSSRSHRLVLPHIVLLCFPPAQNNFYPKCPIYKLTHLQCPGCGATRAAAVLRGDFAEAIHFNALVTLLLPFVAV